MDRGLWITWYDLPAAGRDAYLSWLHGKYIPKTLKHAGMLYGAHYASDHEPPAAHLRHTDEPSVPAGNDYVLVFGAESAHAFSKGSGAYLHGAPARLEAELNDEDRRMLSMRTGERVCIMTEVARRDGPEAHRREGSLAPAPCIQLGTFNDGTTDVEDELMAWYADWRFEALGNLPGCVAIRQLVSVSGWAKHGVLYEFISREARDAHFPKLRKIYPAESVWSERCTPKLLHAPASPIVARRLWPPVK